MRTTILAGLCALATAGAAHAAPVLSYTGGGQFGTRGADATVGWAFDTNTAVAIGSLDSQSLGAGSDDIVRLYDAAGGILASAVVSTTDPVETIAGVVYHVHAIAPVTLAAGAEYFLANDIGPGTQFRAGVASVATDPSITYVGAVSSSGQGGAPVTNALGFGNGDFGPNFDIAVPAPGSLALLGAGLAGLVAIRRRASA